MPTFLVRRSPGHAIVAHVREDETGCTLLRVTPDHGQMPFWADLTDLPHPDRAVLRRALLARMRAIARGEPERTTLDRVLIAPAAYDAWMARARAAANALPAGIDPDSIPDEAATPQPDGSLRISVAIPGGEIVSMDIPPEQWARRDH